MGAKELAAPLDRVGQVFDWILSGASEFEIVQAVESTWPSASVKPLIVDAMQRIADSGCAEGDTLRGWCIEATRRVYQKSLEADDFPTALKAIRQLAEFAGPHESLR